MKKWRKNSEKKKKKERRKQTDKQIPLSFLSLPFSLKKKKRRRRRRLKKKKKKKKGTHFLGPLGTDKLLSLFTFFSRVERSRIMVSSSVITTGFSPRRLRASMSAPPETSSMAACGERHIKKLGNRGL